MLTKVHHSVIDGLSGAEIMAVLFDLEPGGREVDGAMLDDGTWLHWPPHLQDRFADILKEGDRVRATGRTETGPAGDTHFEVQSVTNLGSNATAENPDYADGPPPRTARRVAPGRPADREQRLRDLEDQVDQLRREIRRVVLHAGLDVLEPAVEPAQPMVSVDGVAPLRARPEIDIAGESTRVLVEQIGAVDAQRLGDLMGHVTPEEMWGIDEALATVLGLD